MNKVTAKSCTLGLDIFFFLISGVIPFIFIKSPNDKTSTIFRIAKLFLYFKIKSPQADFLLLSFILLLLYFYDILF